jgi:hypothetical protein
MDILVWPIVLILWIAWGRYLHWQNGLWCELKPGSWPLRTWWKGYRGATLGHGGFYAPGDAGGDGIDTKVEYHEHVHAEQFEVAMLISFLLAVYVFTAMALLGHFDLTPFLCIPIWASGWIVTLAGGWVVALLRGEPVYRGSAHEEAAYAIQEQFPE